jgi:arginine/ornithine N-succinyltransferase beta subunit
MLVMRPAQMADLEEVKRLAADSPIGVTSLPDDIGRLGDKIAASEASFAAEVSFNGEESYFFVLEASAPGGWSAVRPSSPRRATPNRSTAFATRRSCMRRGN